MEKEVFVYVDLRGVQHLVGRLWARALRGSQTASFEYARSWLNQKDRFALEPALHLDPGPFHSRPEKTLFGAIGDSAPDRWGRELMKRAERRRAKKENRAVRTLNEVDYLLMVSDEARPGALRFSETEGGPFLAEPGTGNQIPPLVKLPRLLSASESMMDDKDSEEDLRLLLAPGSSLGGARPKASVLDRDGQLLIAKFPSRHDEVNVVRWEAVALTLARQAGIPTAESRIEKVAGRDVLLLSRFDRWRLDDNQSLRLPFLSAMSMLDAKDGDTRSYLEIAAALQQYSPSPKRDIALLWRRIVFNILISNTDDHLRNHGFLYEGTSGWALAPAYDLNPVPVDIKPRVLSTRITLDDATASLELAREAAGFLGIAKKDSQKIIREVGNAVAGWRKAASKFKIGKAEMDRMASAFEHDDLAGATS